MESNQENIKPIYFVEEQINEYHNLLETVYTINQTRDNQSSPFYGKVVVSNNTNNSGNGQTIKLTDDVTFTSNWIIGLEKGICLMVIIKQ